MKNSFFINSIVVIGTTLILLPLSGMQEKTGPSEYIQFSTLKRKCLNIVIKQTLTKDTPLSPDIIEGLQAFKKLHHSPQDNYLIKAIKNLFSSPIGSLSNDIRSAFQLYAPPTLKEKVERINKKKIKRFDELTARDTNEPNEVVPKALNIFDSLAWILNNHCHNDLDTGLIQISRYRECSKRKVLCGMLLSLGANVNYYGTANPNIRETTPLVTAVIHKRIKLSEMFLENDANPNQPEKYGDTPYTLVKGWEYPDLKLLMLLQQYGAVDTPPCKNNHAPSEKCPLCALQ